MAVQYYYIFKSFTAPAPESCNEVCSIILSSDLTTCITVRCNPSIIFTKCLEVRLPDARTQSDRRRLGSVTVARSRVRVRDGYEFVSCRRHGDQRLIGPVTGPIATS